MSHQNSDNIQKLLGEKEQLKKEEEVLRSMIDQVKKQVNALQVEQLQIGSRRPLARLSPIETIVSTQQQQDQKLEKTENKIPEINLDILGNLQSGSFIVDQGETEEEED